MMSERPLPSRGRALAISAGFWGYAVMLFLVARWISHQYFEGWLARAATMAAIALGLLPWGAWLRPRFVRVIGLIGRVALVACYFTLLAPLAIITRLSADRLRRRRAVGVSRWRVRPPFANTIEAARLEH